MRFHHLNLLAVLAAAASSMVLGFLWYSPALFAKPWKAEAPGDEGKAAARQPSAGPAYAGALAAALVSAFILALFLHEFHAGSVALGLLVSFHVWLGFVAAAQFTGALFTGQSMRRFAIDAAYQLVCYLAMGAILAAWP